MLDRLSDAIAEKQAIQILIRINFMLEICENIYYYGRIAGVAQLVEHLIRNEGVVGSSPITGTRLTKKTTASSFFIY